MIMCYSVYISMHTFYDMSNFHKKNSNSPNIYENWGYSTVIYTKQKYIVWIIICN